MEKVVTSPEKQKGRLEKLKQVSGYIILGISDVLNTLTPPGFEMYLATELSKIDNLTITIKLLQDTVLLEVKKTLYMKHINGYMREEGYKRSYHIVEEEVLGNY